MSPKESSGNKRNLRSFNMQNLPSYAPPLALITILLFTLYYFSFSTSPSTTPKNPSPWPLSPSGFWIGETAKSGHNFDSRLSSAILDYILLHTDDAQQQKTHPTILKLGSGTGAYARHWRKSGIPFTTCYDGNPATQINTDGTCGTLDFSKKLDLPQHDWVISLEVGEHIPREFEGVFLDNVNRHARKGVVLSWAVEGQGGVGHVNERANSYIQGVLGGFGFVRDFEGEKVLRKESTLPWFRNSLMVFLK